MAFLHFTPNIKESEKIIFKLLLVKMSDLGVCRSWLLSKKKNNNKSWNVDKNYRAKRPSAFTPKVSMLLLIQQRKGQDVIFWIHSSCGVLFMELITVRCSLLLCVLSFNCFYSVGLFLLGMAVSIPSVPWSFFFFFFCIAVFFCLIEFVCKMSEVDQTSSSWTPF